MDEASPTAAEDGGAGATEPAREGSPEGSGNSSSSAGDPLAGAGSPHAVYSAGLLNVGHEMNSLLAMSDPDSQLQGIDGWGSFEGDSISDARPGHYGFGPVGTGRIQRGVPGGQGRGLLAQGLEKGRPDREQGQRVLDDHQKKTHQPIMTPGPIKSSGSLNKRLIRKVVRQHRSELKACYERQLQKQKDLSGKITVSWTIDSAGNVFSVEVRDNQMGSDQVAKCITKSIQHWRFPALKSGMTTILYPFIFSLN